MGFRSRQEKQLENTLTSELSLEKPIAGSFGLKEFQFKRIKVEDSPPFYRYPLLHRSRLWIRHTRSKRFHPCYPFCFFGNWLSIKANKDVGHPVPFSKGVEIIPPGSEALQILGGKSETLENTSSRNSRKIWSAQKWTRPIYCREAAVGRRGMCCRPNSSFVTFFFLRRNSRKRSIPIRTSVSLLLVFVWLFDFPFYSLQW